MKPRLLMAGLALALLAVSAGCTSTSSTASQAALAALEPITTSAPTTTSTTALTDSDPCVRENARTFDKTASLRPDPSIPTAGAMPAGTWERSIQDRGVLIVGVDENTRYFSSRNPVTGEFEGFEVELAHEIAEAIFGDRTRVRFVSVVTDEKVPFVRDGKVDMTISVVSASCERWREVSFSTTYYETSQRVLVRQDSPIQQPDDLAGKRVCVTRGSSSEKFLPKLTATAEPVAVTARTDCLVALQERRVDAVLLPNSILAGLQDQDRTTRMLAPLPQQAAQNSYGIAISHQHPDLVRFVNALLERWRTDGTLAALQLGSLPPGLRTDPVAPEPRYVD